MTKNEFKSRWESDDDGGGTTFDDIAACYVSWGLGATPRVKPIDHVLFAVLKAAATVDADEYDPERVDA